MSYIQFKNISKKYHKATADTISNLNLSIDKNDFIVLVGPSGCGKSTTLRMLAGLEEATSGRIFIRDKDVTFLEPQDRELSMVFQNYALYPHMSVEENLAFSLKMKKVDKQTRHEKVLEAANILGLTPYLKRKPKELSGGQRQRVALGRAIVRDVDIFLMDEPLSNLDAKLRSSMRTELLNIHRKLNATTIYVSHDQIEAMTMATKIVIMNAGKIMQIGTPNEVYNDPDNKFVATFIGTPSINILDGKIENDTFTSDDGLEITGFSAYNLKNKSIFLGLRPNLIKIVEQDANFSKQGVITHLELIGHSILIHVTIDDHKLIIEQENNQKHEIGQTVSLAIDCSKTFLFDQETEQRIRLED